MHVLQAAGGAAISGPESRSDKRYWLVAAVIGVLGFVLDQAVKALAIAKLDPGHPVTLIDGLLSLWLIRNPGAAFSMGEGFTVGFTVVAIVALVAVAVWGVPRVRHTGWAVAMGFVLAGISGNLYDRLFREPGPFRGHVVDFIQVPWFAIFNVADIFITATAVLVIAMSFFGGDSASGERPQGSGGADDGREGSR